MNGVVFFVKQQIIPDFSVGEPMVDVQDFFLKTIGVILLGMIVELPAAHQWCGFFSINILFGRKKHEKTILYFGINDVPESQRFRIHTL